MNRRLKRTSLGIQEHLGIYKLVVVVKPKDEVLTVNTPRLGEFALPENRQLVHGLETVMLRILSNRTRRQQNLP
jgi:hypothetical protein